jgi:hypothetical protein
MFCFGGLTSEEACNVFEMVETNQRACFDAHLEGCRRCHTWLDQMRLTIAILGKLIEQSLDLHTNGDLLNVFRNWKRG